MTALLALLLLSSSGGAAAQPYVGTMEGGTSLYLNSAEGAAADVFINGQPAAGLATVRLHPSYPLFCLSPAPFLLNPERGRGPSRRGCLGGGVPT